MAWLSKALVVGLYSKTEKETDAYFHFLSTAKKTGFQSNSTQQAHGNGQRQSPRQRWAYAIQNLCFEVWRTSKHKTTFK